MFYLTFSVVSNRPLSPEGEMKAYFNMVKKGFITTSDAAAELHMSEEEFLNAMNNTHEGVPVMA